MLYIEQNASNKKPKQSYRPAYPCQQCISWPCDHDLSTSESMHTTQLVYQVRCR